MPNVVPGVSYQPIDFSGYPKRHKGRGACAHVAVSNAAALRPSGGNSWHFYLPKAGPAIQYVDLDYVAYAQLNGNPTMVCWESQGGVVNPDSEPWTDNQCEWAARIYAHLHQTEGSPLQVMPNSLPTSRGLGYHRLGIDPWRVAGGEKWSSSAGKICPGSAKIAQIPGIVARAQQLVSGSPAAAPQLLTEESDMHLVQTPDKAVWKITDTDVTVEGSIYRMGALAKARRIEAGEITPITAEELNDNKADAADRRARLVADVVKAVVAQVSGIHIDEKQLAATVVAGLVPQLTTALAAKSAGVSKDDVEDAVRSVLGSLDTPAA